MAAGGHLVHVRPIGQNDRPNVLCRLSSPSGHNSLDVRSIGQNISQVGISLAYPGIGFPDCLRTGHGVRGSQQGSRQVGHGAAHGAEVEGPAGVFSQLDALGGCALDRAFYGIHRGVEVLLGNLDG